MIDDGELDWKVIAIKADDPKAALVNDVEDVERYGPCLYRLLLLYRVLLLQLLYLRNQPALRCCVACGCAHLMQGLMHPLHAAGVGACSAPPNSAGHLTACPRCPRCLPPCSEFPGTLEKIRVWFRGECHSGISCACAGAGPLCFIMLC